ncbi:hypothetical protein [Streptomyces sp. NPDC000880]
MQTRITFTNADYQTGMVFDPVNSALVVQTPGRYLLKGRLLWRYTESETGSRLLTIRVNGGGFAQDRQDTADIPGAAPALISQEVSTIVELQAGAVIDLVALQDTLNPATSVVESGVKFFSPQLQAEWLAPLSSP